MCRLNLSMKRGVWAAAIALAALAVTVAPRAAGGQAAGPIKIGLLTAMTGALAENGTSIAQAVKLYFSEIDNQVAGRKIELITEDTASTVNTGLTKTRKLLERDGVHLILGPVHSGIAMAIRNLVHNRKVPLVITQATANALTQEQASPYVFRASYTSAQVHLGMGPYLRQKLGWRRIAIIAFDFIAGHEHADGFIGSFKEAGGEVGLELYPALGATDMAPYLTRIKSEANRLDGVVAILWGAASIHFIKGYQDYGLKGKIPLLAYGATMDDAYLPTMGEAALGIPSWEIWSRVLDTPENKRFAQAVLTAYDRRVTRNHELGYTAAKAVGEALKAVQGKVEDQEKFLQALRQVRFESPRGPFRFDAKQNAVVTVYLREVRNVGGQLENVVTDSIPDIDQFWKAPK